MLELKSEEQKLEYNLEIARIKARAYTELNDDEVKKANRLKSRNGFVYSFWLMFVATCLGYILGKFAR